MKLFHSPEQSMDSDERFTPQWVFDGLGIVFDLDPCSPVDGGDCVPAERKYTIDDDGLEQPWHGVVWCNPPFSGATAWADRFRVHGNGVFLGPVANARWATDLISATSDARGSVWLCRDFPFTHPTHAGRRSSMPLMFVSLGPKGTAGLIRLAYQSGHPGNLMVVATGIDIDERNAELARTRVGMFMEVDE